ncbi:MAG: hypothetical protein J1E36_01555 [Eubacterium sp.]|nr:hypothetical protein [Eubacterium sp.]
MKKVIVLLLAIIVLISCTFVACSNKDDIDGKTTAEGLEDSNADFGFETQPVTDENGKEVTDENGNVVTTEVAVIYKKDKKGNEYAAVLDSNGEPVTDKNGKEVTIKLPEKETTTTTTNNSNSPSKEGSGNTTTVAPKPTGTTNKKAETTTSASDSKTTTKKADANAGVPKTSDKGTVVNFSQEDQEVIKSMLEVPYLYLESYENSDGIPIDIATHVAVWMAEHEGNSRTVYPSSPVVLNLFKYFGQTVVNFKTKCNDFAGAAGAPIRYVKKDDTFEITNYTSKVQTVTIKNIEDLGNNYYKVTADVKGCEKNKVVAVVQKNRLEATLGFSIKALNWS